MHHIYKQAITRTLLSVSIVAMLTSCGAGSGTVQTCYWFDRQSDQRCDARICPGFTNQWGEAIAQHAAFCANANNDGSNLRVFGCAVRKGTQSIHCPEWIATGDPRFDSANYSPAGEHGTHPQSWTE